MHIDLLPIPRPIQVTEASTRLQYQVAGEFNSTGQNLIGGVHVTRFGVPMVVVQSVVPGARYDIAVWGISVDNTRRSGEPSRQTAVVEERSKLGFCEGWLQGPKVGWRHVTYTYLFHQKVWVWAEKGKMTCNGSVFVNGLFCKLSMLLIWCAKYFTSCYLWCIHDR